MLSSVAPMLPPSYLGSQRLGLATVTVIDAFLALDGEDPYFYPGPWLVEPHGSELYYHIIFLWK